MKNSEHIEQAVIIREVGPSLNKFYSGMHHTKRKRIKDSWTVLVREAVQNQHIIPIQNYPVVIHCRLEFGPSLRRYDWENCAMTAKLIQDGLIKCGILENDSPMYVKNGSLESTKGAQTQTIFTIYENNYTPPFNGKRRQIGARPHTIK